METSIKEVAEEIEEQFKERPVDQCMECGWKGELLNEECCPRCKNTENWIIIKYREKRKKKGRGVIEWIKLGELQRETTRGTREMKKQEFIVGVEYMIKKVIRGVENGRWMDFVGLDLENSGIYNYASYRCCPGRTDMGLISIQESKIKHSEHNGKLPGTERGGEEPKWNFKIQKPTCVVFP
jgi:hypothetical protein